MLSEMSIRQIESAGLDSKTTDTRYCFRKMQYFIKSITDTLGDIDFRILDEPKGWLNGRLCSERVKLLKQFARLVLDTEVFCDEMHVKMLHLDYNFEELNTILRRNNMHLLDGHQGSGNYGAGRMALLEHLGCSFVDDILSTKTDKESMDRLLSWKIKIEKWVYTCHPSSVVGLRVTDKRYVEPEWSDISDSAFDTALKILEPYGSKGMKQAVQMIGYGVSSYIWELLNLGGSLNREAETRRKELYSILSLSDDYIFDSGDDIELYREENEAIDNPKTLTMQMLDAGMKGLMDYEYRMENRNSIDLEEQKAVENKEDIVDSLSGAEKKLLEMLDDEEESKKCPVYIPQSVKDAVKSYAAVKGISMYKAVAQAVKNELLTDSLSADENEALAKELNRHGYGTENCLKDAAVRKIAALEDQIKELRKKAGEAQ